MTERKLVVAAAIVDDLEHPRALLAAQRAYPEKWRGYWELPGGKVDEDDTSPLEALVREIREELGISLAYGPVLPCPDSDAEASDWPILEGRFMRVWLAQLPGDYLEDGAGDKPARPLVASRPDARPNPAGLSPADHENTTHQTTGPNPTNLSPAPHENSMDLASGILDKLPKVEPGDSHLELRWLPFDQILSVDWLPADVPIAKAVASLGKDCEPN